MTIYIFNNRVRIYAFPFKRNTYSFLFEKVKVQLLISKEQSFHVFVQVDNCHFYILVQLPDYHSSANWKILFNPRLVRPIVYQIGEGSVGSREELQNRMQKALIVLFQNVFLQLSFFSRNCSSPLRILVKDLNY